MNHMVKLKPKFAAFPMPGALILTVFLAACATTAVHIPEIPELLNQSGHDIPTVDLLRTTLEMQEFVQTHASKDRTMGGRAWSLAYASLDPYLLNFDYDPLVTLPADQAFLARKGNCLTFSSMFIAMARDAGLTSWYQEVKVPPKWSTANDTLLVSMHVNAVVRDRGREYVVDVSRRKKQPVEQSRKMSDIEARGQYYNNLGADALVVEDLALAYAYFKKALQTDNTLAYVWSNLGVVMRRNGQTEDSILAYQTSLLLDPQQAVALNNLYTIYSEDGEIELAREIEARVERNRSRNPYYLHHLAEVAIEEQRYSDAIPLLNKSISIESNEYRFYYTLAQAQYLTGETELAQSSLEVAKRLAPSSREGEMLTLPDGSL